MHPRVGEIMSWNLKEGHYTKENISEDEIWGIFNSIFSSKTHNTTTYKYCFLKCLVDNIFNVDEKLSLEFDVVFTRFTEVYWNLVVRHKLRQIQENSQWQRSAVEEIIENFLNKYDFSREFAFEGLKNNYQLELISQIRQVGSKYVIGAFYSDSKGTFYSFSKAEKRIIFNPKVYAMIVKYKSIIEKINYYEWIKFLEKVNIKESSYSIAEKLDYSTKRNNLINYKETLFGKSEHSNCFYCGKGICKNSIEVDHFIPWSFVKDDKLWNFVLSCPRCNNSKRDRLAIDKYKYIIIERNKLIINNVQGLGVNLDFKGYTEVKILSMYKSAIFNGFTPDWQPKIV
ncbi:MAG: HNH endonuclease domain-containing protein [Eubacteriales bacterium]